MGEVIRPDFKARRRKAKLIKQQQKRDELVYKLRPYLELFAVVLVIGAMVSVLSMALR